MQPAHESARGTTLSWGQLPELRRKGHGDEATGPQGDGATGPQGDGAPGSRGTNSGDGHTWKGGAKVSAVTDENYLYWKAR